MDAVAIDLRNEIEDFSLTGIAPTRHCGEEASFDAIIIERRSIRWMRTPGAGAPSLLDKSSPIANAFSENRIPIGRPVRGAARNPRPHWLRAGSRFPMSATKKPASGEAGFVVRSRRNLLSRW